MRAVQWSLITANVLLLLTTYLTEPLPDYRKQNKYYIIYLLSMPGFKKPHFAG